MTSFSAAERAAVTRVDATAAAATEVLAFRLGREEYGIDILRVQEIRSFEVPTRIAGAPQCVLGVLNLRGSVVPVVDLRMHFGVKADYEALTATVVLNLGGRTIGMVVDAVSDVIVIDGGQLKAAPSFGDRIDVGYITALGALGEGERQRMLILMDVELLIRSADLGLVD